MSIAEKFEVIADAVYEKGKVDEHSDFWDVFMNNGMQMSNYQYAFAYEHWNDVNYNPKYTKIIPSYSCSFMFYNSPDITDTKIEIDVHLAKASDSVFRSATGLKTIRKLTVNENNTYSRWFANCSSLENITFEGVIGNNISFADCALLNKASIINIFEHLSTTVSGKTFTLNKTAVNTAFGIDVDDETTYTDEWNALINSVSNWTISFA